MLGRRRGKSHVRLNLGFQESDKRECAKRDARLRDRACGMVVFNRWVTYLCVTVIFVSVFVKYSSTGLVRFQAFEHSKQEDKSHVCGKWGSGFRIISTAGMFRLLHITAP
jgi:hypothetical protein